jgi:DNA-binding transcriptional regulator YhcF (GntR family)
MLEQSDTRNGANLSHFSIDRDLPVAIGAQLRGLIEFGIALGTLRPGERLPSVRDLAEHLGIAPMTVAAVYADLKGSGAIVSRQGSGTFVADIVPAARHPAQHGIALHRAVDALIRQGRALGLRASDIAGLIAARMKGADRDRPLVVVVGHFAQSTAIYCTEMADTMADPITIEPTTLRLLQTDPGARQRAALADLVVTFAHRRRDVMDLLPDIAVAAVTFIPSTATRQALASLDPGTRIGAVSVFPEFTSLMKAGIQRFAPHVSEISVVHHGTPELADMLARVDVVVFATGADDLGLALPNGMPAFEYRHTPDPADVRRLLEPLFAGEADDQPAMEGML